MLWNAEWLARVDHVRWTLAILATNKKPALSRRKGVPKTGPLEVSLVFWKGTPSHLGKRILKLSKILLGAGSRYDLIPIAICGSNRASQITSNLSNWVCDSVNHHRKAPCFDSMHRIRRWDSHGDLNRASNHKSCNSVLDLSLISQRFGGNVLCFVLPDFKSLAIYDLRFRAPLSIL